MRVLVLDCTHGATCAMILAALSDAGLKPSALEWELSNVELDDFHMHFDQKERDGHSGIAFTLHAGHSHGAGDCCGDHDHHDEEPPKTLADLRTLIGSSDLSDPLKAKVLGVFERLAAAEGAVQQVAPEAAVLHEAGGLEGIVPVLSVVIGLEALGIEQVMIAPLREGKGWIQNASGRSEIPSPVTLALLKEAPLTVVEEPFQLLAPLPAALIAGIAGTYGPRPDFKGETVKGYGINPRRFPAVPSVVVAEIGEL